MLARFILRIYKDSRSDANLRLLPLMQICLLPGASPGIFGGGTAEVRVPLAQVRKNVGVLRQNTH